MFLTEATTHSAPQHSSMSIQDALQSRTRDVGHSMPFMSEFGQVLTPKYHFLAQARPEFTWTLVNKEPVCPVARQHKQRSVSIGLALLVSIEEGREPMATAPRETI